MDQGVPAHGPVTISPFCFCSCLTNLFLTASEPQRSCKQDSSHQEWPQAPATKSFKDTASWQFLLLTPIISADIPCARGEPRWLSRAQRLGCCCPAETGHKNFPAHPPPSSFLPSQWNRLQAWVGSWSQATAAPGKKPQVQTLSEQLGFLGSTGSRVKERRATASTVIDLWFTSRCLWVERQQK